MAQIAVEKTLTDYIQGFKRLKWQILIPMVVTFVIVALIAVLIPAIYRSTAVILIEQQDIPSEMVQSTITSFADERIQVISQRVMTTTNLTKVMKKYDLYKVEREKDASEEVIQQMRDDIKLETISADVIDPRSGRPTVATIAFKLSYESRSPELAQKVANELVSLYLNENLKSRSEKAAEATDFLSLEANKLREQISDIEKRMAEFKEKNANSLPELKSLNLSMLERTERELFEVERRISSNEESKIYLESELEQVSPSATVFSDSGERIMTAQGRLKALETKYLSMSSQYSPDHPDLIRMQRELASLRKEVGGTGQSRAEVQKQIAGLQGELATLRETHAAEHPDVKKLSQQIEALQKASKKMKDDKLEKADAGADNPVYVQLKTKLEAVNSDLNSLRTSRKKLKARLAEIEAYIVQTPQVEREYLNMTRDHTTASAKYQEITAKQMSAQLAEELEKGSKGERFSLIEPPLLPEKPVKPNRLAILFLGFIVSVGLGAGILFFRETMDKSIRSPKDITSLVGMPPLATIPYIITDRETGQASRSRVKQVASLVMVIAIAFVVTHLFYKPLDVIWFVAMRKLGL